MDDQKQDYSHDHEHEHGHDHEDSEETREELRRLFSHLKNKVHVLLFTKKGENDVYNDIAHKVLQWFGRITDKIVVTPYSLSHALAKKYGVTRSPSLVFAPDTCDIKWLGAPAGEEGRAFVELVILLGTGKSGLSEDSEKIIRSITDKKHIRLFVSPTCPYCPQQAVNACKAAVAKPGVVSLEIIDVQAFPDIADAYDAQSVPQAFANDELIAMGAQAEELFCLSLEKMSQQNLYIPDDDAPLVETDLLIIGGGPAGLTAGIYAARSGLNAVLLEKDTLGGQVTQTPVVENYPGMTHVGGKALADVMVTHALEYVRIYQGEEAMDIQKNEKGLFTISTNRRKFTARAILLATGAKHRQLQVPGESKLSGRGVSYCSTCDGPFFKDKKVIIVGGGDSAATEALHLKNIGVDVSIVHWQDKLKAQHYLAKQLHDNNIEILFNTEVKEIHGERSVEKVTLYNHLTRSSQMLAVDGVFIAIGYVPAVSLAQKIGVELTPAGYIRQENFRTSVKGIYTAGDVTGGYNQIVIASGQGSGAAMAIFEDLINPYWKGAAGDKT
ncbi:MAG: FAD-dependent oxidoreductase [Desulfosalsimonadaceae bacterium]